MNPSFARIVEINEPGKPLKWRVAGSYSERFVAGCDGFCWMAGAKWLPPYRQNVRFYSKFASREAAVRAIPECVILVNP